MITPTASTLDHTGAPAARGFLATFGLLAAGLACLTLAALMLIDPYGAGRLLPRFLDRPLAVGASPAFSSAARLRDPSFDAFVFGNSTLQTLDPDRLNGLTGRRFAQATVPGTGPLEQTQMLAYASRVRSTDLQALVLGLDFSWCNASLMTRGQNPFPLWLYEASLARYLKGLFRFNSIEALPPRVASLTGRVKPSRADGFWNYELHVPPRPYPYGTPQVAQAQEGQRSAARSLRAALAGLPARTRVALVLPPVYLTADDGGNFETLTGAAACKEELIAAGRERPNTDVIDMWRDSDFARDRRNFLDSVHFREPVARLVEKNVAAALR